MSSSHPEKHQNNSINNNSQNRKVFNSSLLTLRRWSVVTHWSPSCGPVWPCWHPPLIPVPGEPAAASSCGGAVWSPTPVATETCMGCLRHLTYCTVRKSVMEKIDVCQDIQWGKKVFSQPPIVQVLPLKNMRPVIFIIGTLQLWQAKWEKKSRKSHSRIFNEFICKLWWKISIRTISLPFVFH